ncbi:hypothetical protein HYU21_03485, partial [Candidatus Woesearchaeota archaeon]|nr:hypothetical protein [Candidatus Woesearchaeota archaeon]
MEVIEITQENEKFDLFLRNNQHFIYHTLTFKKFIEEAFDCSYRILAAINGGYILTILPIVEVKSNIFGSKIISTAYLEYGGFSGEESGVKPIMEFLQREYSNNFDYLEIRGGHEKFDNLLSNIMLKKDHYKRFILSLSSEEETWKNIQHSKRKAVNRALSVLEVKEIGLNNLNEFYRL